jgi:BA14K-like protein
MSRLGILGAAALSLTLAAATPALAQHMRGGAAVRAGGSAGINSGTAFRGAQASIGTANVARTGNAQFAAGRTGPQFSQGQVAQGQFARGEFRDRDRDGRFGRGAGFVTGLAVGSAFGYGAYDPYYYDDYAYNDYYDGSYDTGYPVDTGVVVSNAGGDPTYCAQRYRSYDPATGTYLGFDGLRHPCL